MLEIAGMAASYEEGQPERILSFVVNEYEYEESAAAVLGMIRIGSAREGEDSRRIVRQSVCYDTKMQAPERFNIVLTKVSAYPGPESLIFLLFFFLVQKKKKEESNNDSLQHCKERARDEIIQSEEFTLAMIEQVVSQMEPSDRIIFEYRYTESEDLLEFDLQLRPYDVESVFRFLFPLSFDFLFFFFFFLN